MLHKNGIEKQQRVNLKQQKVGIEKQQKVDLTPKNWHLPKIALEIFGRPNNDLSASSEIWYTIIYNWIFSYK